MDFLNGSFKVGRLFGIDIRVHILFVIWIAFRLFQSGNMQSAAMFLGMLFGIVLLHEFGHCFGARLVGGDAQNILMWPLGGLAYAYAPMRPWPQFVTVAAGPAVNVILAIISGVVLAVTVGTFQWQWLNPLGGPPQFIGVAAWVNWVALFLFVNVWLLAFNLLPIYPLDGGQIFHAIIWPWLGLQRATMVACQAGIAGAIFFGLWGLGAFGSDRHPILVLIAVFGGFTCWQRLQAARHGMLIEDDRFSVQAMNRGARTQSWWSRLFGDRSRPRRSAPTPNPNPGGWEARQSEAERLEAEVDRILQKVREQGTASLSYVELETLKRATERRRAAERDFDRRTGV